MAKINVGDRATKVVKITEKLINEFADVSTDHNPIHLDEEYAKSSVFKKRIAHGMLSASFISSVIGNNLPGNGTIYMSQSLKFIRPVFIGDIITTEIEVIKTISEKSCAILSTKCINQNNECVIEGEALVKNKEAFKEG